ncbi:MalY/PatB family protein [Paenibacillus hunanensis]|uniref:cysteine-S-conjugate beta-lyase n=1 Tax=Paenibacillus hunanensis TaxID=539262 RepID=A0ABU1J363_9BACL|nr:MalY/PatB family protein [Paenibacillus hunanensis]MDR6245939.1 cystathionine beta-lyase [Paenibacillus hunanensis]GGJ25584.1 cystathionine beta-lyase [Paenibacillus hunanensis]
MDYTEQFDHPPQRTGTNSEKWDKLQHLFGTEEALPLWVADMDFAVPQPVQDALKQSAEHGVIGYSFQSDAYYEALQSWMRSKHGWEIQKDWVVFTPGVVASLNFAVHTFTEPGDRVMIQTPVYPPFYSVITGHGREVVENPLQRDEAGRYTMDFEHLERTLDSSIKMFILCSPHNPIGRVWTREELERLEELCAKHDILVVSDEIHGDLVYGEEPHIPFAMLSERARNRSIICTAPSKTFNIAGLNTSNIIIPNEELRNAFALQVNKFGTGHISQFGVVATQAAYNGGKEWLDQCLAYTRSNMEYVQQYIAEHLPEVKVWMPEATYLLWLDFSRLGMEQTDLVHFMLHEAKVALNDGRAFGTTGEGFLRMNVACSRQLLEEAMNRIHNAIAKRRQHENGELVEASSNN